MRSFSNITARWDTTARLFEVHEVSSGSTEISDTRITSRTGIGRDSDGSLVRSIVRQLSEVEVWRFG